MRMITSFNNSTDGNTSVMAMAEVARAMRFINILFALWLIRATINMDGTALYQTITTLFIAQAYGLEMSILNIIVVIATIVAASIGTPAIPGGGVVILASVLGGVGIPAVGIIIIIGVERLLEMFRTAVNVTGDLTACVVFDRFYGKTSVLIRENKVKQGNDINQRQ